MARVTTVTHAMGDIIQGTTLTTDPADSTPIIPADTMEAVAITVATAGTKH